MQSNIKDINFFNKNGWLRIQNFYSKKDLSIIKKKLNEILKNASKKYNSHGRHINLINGVNNKKIINSFHKLHDYGFVKKLARCKKVQNLVNGLLNTKKVKLRASEFFAKPKKIGLGVPPHQDNYYWCVNNSKALTIWISLDKSTKKNGALSYYSGSHKYGVLNHRASYHPGTSQKVPLFKKIKKLKKETPKLNPGDALLHHCLIVHGSEKNSSSKSRRGLTFQFMDKKSKVDQRMKKKYENSLKSQLKKRFN